MAYKLTHDDLVAKLRSHIGFLERSAQAFDNGFEDEALRLAGSLRTLLYDKPGSPSLLAQLGEQQRLKFLDTATRVQPENLLSTPGLVRFKGEEGRGARYDAPLGDLTPGRRNIPKPFAAWWDDPVTYVQPTGLRFARRDYVLKAANKEFAHIDPELDEAWARLTRENALGFMTGSDTNPALPMDSPALASIRQITYEVDQTLRSQLSQLL